MNERKWALSHSTRGYYRGIWLFGGGRSPVSPTVLLTLEVSEAVKFDSCGAAAEMAKGVSENTREYLFPVVVEFTPAGDYWAPVEDQSNQYAWLRDGQFFKNLNPWTPLNGVYRLAQRVATPAKWIEVSA